MHRKHRFYTWIAAWLALVGIGCGRGVDPSRVNSSDEGHGELGPPNIVLVVAGDVSVSENNATGDSYGIRGLARDGVRLPTAGLAGFARSAAHSALLTGVHPTALGLTPVSDVGGEPAGVQRAKGSRPGLAGSLPAELRVFPELLRRAGYYTVLKGHALHDLVVSEETPSRWSTRRATKRDDVLLGAWDASGPGLDWRRESGEPCTVAFGCGRYTGEPDGPFFLQVNMSSDSDVDEVVTGIMEQLAADEIADDTAVLLVGLSESSSFIAKWPGLVEPGAERADLVTLVDLAPTILALARAPLPSYLVGRAVLDRDVTAVPIEVTETEDHLRLLEPWPDGVAPVTATPAGYPTGGVFHVAPRVELWCDSEGGSIVYSTELSPPYHWRLYTEPFRMRFWKLRFQCGRLGYRDSPVVTYDFDIE